MSSFNWSSAFGFGLPQMAAISPTPAPPVTQAVTVEDQIDRRSMLGIYGGPGRFPGFDNAPPFTPAIAWQMRRYSAIDLVYSTCIAPILGGMRTIEKCEDWQGSASKSTVEEWQKKASADVLPAVEEAMEPGCECLHFGNWTQELVWEARNGRTVPGKVRSILPGTATLYRDTYGDFAGFRLFNDYRDARYALHIVNEPHIDPIFGYSRNENCREEWWRARQSNLNADRTERKASGIQMVIEAPMGMTFTDDTGQQVSMATMIQTVTDSAVLGNTITVPLSIFSKANILQKPELAEIPLFRIKQLDWGNVGPALLAHLSRLDQLNRDIIRAWRRPEREATEGEHGTKAEAGTHGAIGTTDSELIHASICRQMTKQMLDRYLATNYGPQAVGSLHIKPAPLSDPQQSFLQEVVTTLAGSTEGPDFTLEFDKRALAKKTEIPLRDETLVAKDRLAAEQNKVEAAKQFKQPADPRANLPEGSQQGYDKANGNGDARKLALAVQGLSRIGEYLE